MENDTKLISPQEVYDDPKRWLSVPHELHKSLMGLMKMMYPDFESRIRDIHCIECQGFAPFHIIDKETFEVKLCTGYIMKDGEVDLLRVTELPERSKPSGENCASR